MKEAKKTSETFLSEGRRDLLASCLVITTAFILAFNVVGFSAEAYSTLFAVDGAYAALLSGFILLLTGKVKSEVLKDIVSFLGVVSAVASIFLLWAVFSLQI